MKTTKNDGRPTRAQQRLSLELNHYLKQVREQQEKAGRLQGDAFIARALGKHKLAEAILAKHNDALRESERALSTYEAMRDATRTLDLGVAESLLVDGWKPTLLDSAE